MSELTAPSEVALAPHGIGWDPSLGMQSGTPAVTSEAITAPPIKTEVTSDIGAPPSAVTTEVQGPQLSLNQQAPASAPAANFMVPPALMADIEEAARLTGLGRTNYLVKVAQAESALGKRQVSATSNARGVYQFIPDTWKDMMQNYGSLYSLPTNTDVMDQRANTIMAAQYAKNNEMALKAAFPGREISDGDLYTAHFLGTGGAKNFIRGVLSDPNQRADELAERTNKGAAAANYNIFYRKDGTPRTARETYNILTAKVDSTGMVAGADPNAPRNPTQAVLPRDLYTPPDVPLNSGYSAAQQESIRRARGDAETGAWDVVGAAASTTLTAKLFNNSIMSTADPNYAVPKELINSVPKEYQHRFEGAVSSASATKILNSINNDMESSRILAQAGIKGTTAAVLMNMLDPTALAMGVSTGAIGASAAMALRLGRGGTLAVNAAAGAAGNLAVDGALYGVGEETSASQIAISAALGAAFGAAFMGKLPDAEARYAANQIRRAEALAAEEVRGSGSGGVGAAVNPNITGDSLLNNPSARGLQSDDVPMGRGVLPAFSAGRQVATSENTWTRAMGTIMPDVLGKVDGNVNSISAAERADLLEKKTMGLWARAVRPAYDEWAKENLTGVFAGLKRRASVGINEFKEEAAAYVRNKDTAADGTFSPAAKRAGEAFRQNMRDLLEKAKAAGVPGADGVEVDPHYVPRQWSLPKVSALRQRMADGGISDPQDSLLKGVRAAIQAQNPEIPVDKAEALARALIEKPRTKQYINEDPFGALNRMDYPEALAHLQTEMGLDKTAAEEILHAIKVPSEAGGKDANMKFRVQLDESKLITENNGFEWRISDLFENDLDKLLQGYTRRTAGRIALSEHKVINPKTGEIIIDGFKTDADFKRGISYVEKYAADNNLDPVKTKKDIANLEWGYDHILGRPDPNQMTEYAEAMRILRNYNSFRLMGQLGMNQMMDDGRIIGEFGLPSYLQNMYPYKRILGSDGRFIQKWGIDSELEDMMGAGADQLRILNGLIEDNVAAGTSRSSLEKLGGVMEQAADLTYRISGAHAMNARLELLTGRAVAGKFARMIEGGVANISKRDRQRMLDIGLSEKNLDRILKNMEKNSHIEDGFLFGKKVTKLNLDKWADQEARMMFEEALFRYVSRMTQRNQVGTMHRWMSNPLAQTFAQYKSYSLHAWDNQLNRALTDRTMETGPIMWGLLVTSLIYAAQSHIQAVGRSDAKDFLEKRGFGAAFGTPEGIQKLALGVVGKTGFVSVLPTAAATLLMATPWGAQFGNSTASGRPMDAIMGNPTVGLLNTVGQASKGAINAATGGQSMTQPTARALGSLAMPNAFPVINIFSSMISNLPEK